MDSFFIYGSRSLLYKIDKPHYTFFIWVFSFYEKSQESFRFIYAESGDMNLQPHPQTFPV